RPLCSPQNVERHSRPLASRAWSNAPAARRNLVSRRIPTCSGTPAATRWRTGTRYEGTAGLPRPPQYTTHGALHRVVADPVQGLLAELTVVERRQSVISATFSACIIAWGVPFSRPTRRRGCRGM